MNKKEFIENYLKYSKQKDFCELGYNALTRSFDMKRMYITYKGNFYIDPKNNIQGLNYSLRSLKDNGENYNFISVKYNFTYTNTKFIDFYIKIDGKFYIKCFNMEDSDEQKDYKIFTEFLIDNIK